jgi:hypothetical protein
MMSWLASAANWVALLATSGLIFLLHRRLRNMRGDLRAYRRAIGEMTVALSAADRALRGLLEEGHEVAATLAGSVTDAQIAATAARAAAAAAEVSPPRPATPAAIVAPEPAPPPAPKPLKIWQQPMARPQPLSRAAVAQTPAAKPAARAFWPTVSTADLSRATAAAGAAPILARYREFA